MMNNFKITTLTAFVAIDPQTGDEGVIGLPLPGNALCMPAIGADETRIKALYPMVVNLCVRAGVEFKVLQFGFMEDITEEIKTKYIS